jgi:hypothetical protein
MFHVEHRRQNRHDFTSGRSQRRRSNYRKCRRDREFRGCRMKEKCSALPGQKAMHCAKQPYVAPNGPYRHKVGFVRGQCLDDLLQPAGDD